MWEQRRRDGLAGRRVAEERVAVYRTTHVQELSKGRPHVAMYLYIYMTEKNDH